MTTPPVPAENPNLPSRKRLEIMCQAMQAAREIRDCVLGGSQEDNEDAAVVVDALLAAVDAINRKQKTQSLKNLVEWLESKLPAATPIEPVSSIARPEQSAPWPG